MSEPSQAPKFESLLLSRDGAVAKITLNRPHRLNAMPPEMLEEISEVLDQLGDDKEIRCIIITGAGDRSFSTGADMTAFTGVTPATAVDTSLQGQDIAAKIERLSKPVIAAINGFALGGGLEVALACDFRIASENAELGMMEMKRGLVPGWGGTQRLPRIVGLAKAKELILSGDRITAEEALKIGLVNKVVPRDKLEEETNNLAKSLAEGPPIALKLAKQLLNFGTQGPLEVGLKMEAEAFGVILSTKDVMEGVSAFVSKRKPEFKGK